MTGQQALIICWRGYTNNILEDLDVPFSKLLSLFLICIHENPPPPHSSPDVPLRVDIAPFHVYCPYFLGKIFTFFYKFCGILTFILCFMVQISVRIFLNEKFLKGYGLLSVND